MKRVHINSYKEVVTSMLWFFDRKSPKNTGIKLNFWPRKSLHEVVVQAFDKLVIKSSKMKYIKK